MTQSVCQQCGSTLFLGEQRCGNCKAPAPAEVASFGREAREAGGTGPPEAGLSLIVQKGIADQDIMYQPDPSGPVGLGPRVSMGEPRYTLDEQLDAISDVMKVQRDRQGNVIWDWKNALVGGIVVAVFVGLAVWWFVGSVQGVSVPKFSGSGR